MRELCGQPDALCVFSLLCLWTKICTEHAQTLCHVPEDLLKQKVVMVGHH